MHDVADLATLIRKVITAEKQLLDPFWLTDKVVLKPSTKNNSHMDDEINDTSLWKVVSFHQKNKESIVSRACRA